MNELLLEKVIDIRDDSFVAYRAVLFEVDEEFGGKSVTDIVEFESPTAMAKYCSYLGWDGVTFAEKHKDVDFGRATRFQTKVLKILASL